MRLSSTTNALTFAALSLSACGNSTGAIDANKMTNETFSEEQKLSNQDKILIKLASYSEDEIKDCVSSMEWAVWVAKSNPKSGLNLDETINQRFFWTEALWIKTGDDLTLPEILESSNFHVGQAEMSREEGGKFQDKIANGCVVKMANALRDIGVSTRYEQ